MSGAMTPGAGSRAVIVGECLVELVRTGRDELSIRPAGDTFNTASTLARAARALGTGTEVEYRTGLGDDPLSDAIAEALAQHGLVDGAVRVPGGACGLYLLDGASGEMWYWRGDSAARTVFRGTDWIPDGAPADLAFLSSITLQQMSGAARDRALEWFAEVRGRGGLAAFSANHRPAGWDSTDDAAAEVSRFVSAADVVFASATDCRSLFGDDHPEAALDRLTGFGPSETVLTSGAAGARVGTRGRRIDVPATPADAVDPTGAGDAFAGAYLAWRLAGRPPEAAARAAAGVAARTVTFLGALPRGSSEESAAMDGLVTELSREP